MIVRYARESSLDIGPRLLGNTPRSRANRPDMGKEHVEAAFRADMAVEAAFLSKLAAKDRAKLAKLLRLLIVSMTE